MHLNHVLVRTTNLDAADDFWVEVIGLSQIPRPPFPFAGKWFGAHGQAIVHVVEDRGVNPAAGPIAHVALEGANYDTLLSRLTADGVSYLERDVPHSGERQVFVQGPDGLIVEMLFPAGSSDTARPYAEA